MKLHAKSRTGTDCSRCEYRLNIHQTESTAICEWPRVVLIYSRMDINWRNKLNLAVTNASKTIIDICITCKPVLWSASPGALNIQTRSQNKKIDAQCMLKRWPFFQVVTKAKNLLHNLCRVSDNHWDFLANLFLTLSKCCWLQTRLVQLGVDVFFSWNLSEFVWMSNVVFAFHKVPGSLRKARRRQWEGHQTKGLIL